MKLVFCIDERGGMMFNKRRVSRDSRLIENLAELVGDDTLFIEPYSEELFSGCPLNIICSSEPMKSADKGDFAFIERFDPHHALDCAEELVIYNWNRRYPADLSFKQSPEAHGFAALETVEFKGNSHDKITRTIYRRK